MEFIRDKHIEYIRKVSVDTESFEFLVSQHLRMSGVYWGLTALVLLGVDLKKESFSEGMIEWIMSCYDSQVGGFGGNTHHDPHILYTLSALQILALYDCLSIVDRPKIVSYIASLQQPDGSFIGDQWGEVDTRFSYCALNSLSLLDALHNSEDPCPIDLPRAVAYLTACRNFDGGFGAVPGAESHAGQIFTCIAALSIAGEGALLGDKGEGEGQGGIEGIDLLGWWLAERQCDSGGLNGRPEKQADVCYSWWILSTLSILGRVAWIDTQQLAAFILQCQDGEGGGIADRPGNLPDVFHTFFGLCGLLLLGHFPVPRVTEGGEEERAEGSIQAVEGIDPTYALPVSVVQRMGLKSARLTLP